MSDVDQGLDLASASALELAGFARRHGVALERLMRCQKYLRTVTSIRGTFRLLPLEADTEPALVLRLVRDDGAWVEVPPKIPSEHLVALLEILGEG